MLVAAVVGVAGILAGTVLVRSGAVGNAVARVTGSRVVRVR